MEREEKASKEAILYCSPRAEKESLKEKASPKEKAKESRERAKAIAKAKDRKERTLVA
jgi:hypothetical protein